MRDNGVTEEQAKWVLYNAIVGQSSWLVISSMNPELMGIQHMEFREYLRWMGEKFTPATESIQMEAEYQKFCFDANCVEAFGARVVNVADRVATYPDR